MKTLIPTSNRVIVRRKARETQTEAGIFLPTEMRQPLSREGTVVSVGPGKQDSRGNLIPMTVAKGDRVYFAPRATTQIKDLDEDLLIVNEEDILAIITDEPD